MEKKLISLLLKKEFYDNNKHKVLRTMFPDEFQGLYDVIVEGHNRYNRDIKLSELQALYKILNPTATKAAITNIYELVLDLEETESYEPDIAEDVLHYVWKQEICRQVVADAFDVMEGKKESLIDILQIIEKTQEDFTPTDDIEHVTQDPEELLTQLADRDCWKFNIGVLQKRVEGGGPGEFAIAFARPETGKTAFHVSLAAGENGFLEQGARVCVITNEEPAVITMQRAMCCAVKVDKNEIWNQIDKAKEIWGDLGKSYFVVDGQQADMSIEKLDAYCRRYKPDVLVLDQLDKIGIVGTFQRTDQKLREIYRQAREVAKRHKCFVIGISQASADGEDKTHLTYAMLDESKTGKAAEADLIIGIGKRPMEESSLGQESKVRYLTLSKNKISGWHGTEICNLEADISYYHD